MSRIVPLLFLALFSVAAVRETTREPRWWKGNTHTHTLWSDGDGAPELVAKWYVDHGYDFLVLSDHNKLSRGDKWFPVRDEEGSRLTSKRVEELEQTTGDVEVREVEGAIEMRLKTLEELRELYEEPGEFLFIQGEEITDAFEGKYVHVNGLNLDEVIPPQGGTSVLDTINRNIAAVVEYGEREKRPVLAHVNHPNFGWSVTADDIAQIRGDRFFEVYNGHPAVGNEGDDEHPDTETLWDTALTRRLTELDLGLLYGLATDDAHQYHRWGVGKVNPGRGWVMVRARELTPESILDAMHAGDFYSSSGVTLSDVSVDGKEYRIEIEAEEGLRYKTEFIGSQGTVSGDQIVGVVFATTYENPAVYRLQGSEIYVRAKVTSSRKHPNPYKQGDFETAWTQPVVPGR